MEEFPWRHAAAAATAAAAAKSLQSCLTLCNPIDGSPPDSPIPGILQARTLEWVAFPSPMHESEKSKWSRSVVSDSSWLHGLQSTRLLRPWDFPGKSTGVGCHCLLHCYRLGRNISSTVHCTLMVSPGGCSFLNYDDDLKFEELWKVTHLPLQMYVWSLRKEKPSFAF